MTKENSIGTNGNVPDLKDMYISPAEIRLKEVLEKEEVQKALRRWFPAQDTKSTHKMRKTYASNLNANGVPLDCIREMLGHSNLSTTLEYIYNPLTEKETYDLISKAL